MTTTITYEGTMPGSRIQSELIERHEDGSVTVVHPDGNPWTYRVRAEQIIAEDTTATEETTVERVILKVTDRQGYSPDQVTQTMSLYDLQRAIEQAIEDFGGDALIITDNGDRYGATFGGVDPWAETFTSVEQAEEAYL